MKKYITSALAISAAIFISACGTTSQIKSVNPDNEINEPCGDFLISEDFKKVEVKGRWYNFMNDDGKCLSFAQETLPMETKEISTEGLSFALDILDFALVVLVPNYTGTYIPPGGTYTETVVAEPKAPIDSIHNGEGKFKDMKYYHWMIKSGSGYEKTYILRPDSGKQYRIIYSEKTDDLKLFKDNSELVKLIGFRDNSNN